MNVQCSYILSLWLLFHLLTVSECNIKTVNGLVGENVILPCRYDTSYHGGLHICWGRGEIPSSGCKNEIISTDGNKVTMRKSDRYQLLSGLKEGDVSLTITKAQESDAGVYGCRVHIPGLFNDQKDRVNLILTHAPVPATNASDSPSNVIEQTTIMMWATHNQTQGANSSGSSDPAIPQNSEAAQLDSPQLAVLLTVLLLLLLVVIIVFLLLMRKRWKKASELLGISQRPDNGVLYRNSESSLGLYTREMAVENIYQLDETEDYEMCP
ncbi:hypothetical protein AAFF_G00247010 [Aldrovandia affinis]|uniref:Ig-like domain-containing protein n=1 Tax=Aldrovandia affinis TaxID=143900 RepID=A0AAD7WTW0_9TELE|nr:hypothetical protein AAFF_G00247010 [Aldrovandia affinis]